MITQYTDTRVITRNVVSDWLQGIKNFLGMRLSGYEKGVQDSLDEMLQDMRASGKILWYRIDTDELTNAGIMIILYGEVER